MKKKIFIGVAWPYVNGDIHIGHLAGYLLPADIFARFQRFRGNDVLMASGSDCFGTPITIEADKLNISPEEVVSKYHPQIVKLFEKVGISFDIYTKTTTDNHKEVVQDFFIKLLKEGFIFKDKTGQYYSPEDKKFLPDRYVEGKCPHCGYEGARSDQCENCGAILGVGELVDPKSKLSSKSVRIKPTEHYFLDWPKLQDFLEKYVDEKGKGWRPWVLKETRGWLKKGLKPRPITRDLDWGIEIPIERIPKELQMEGVEHKRIYVWFDAVIGYLSASIEWASKESTRDWKAFWYNKEAEHSYFMGKDNLVFHTLFWPGELYGYDGNIHLPDFPAINQFLTLEDQKFSKSRGITIDSRYITETYGLDTVRFYLTLIGPESADANFSWSDFVSKNNDLLIGNFGNFVNRTLTLAKDLDFSKELEIDEKVETRTLEFIGEGQSALESHKFKKYTEIILELSNFGNKYLSTEEPWFLKDKDPERFEKVLLNATHITLGLLLLIKPLLPESYKLLSGFLGVDIKKWEDSEKEPLRSLLTQVRISGTKPLFGKIDESIVEVERAKISP
ncbi:MAG: methionine--tRNA ligase [Patescibacteria group bacterium]|nr:methionine--tRNA ligase [Patescibacteria group bacterium]